MEIEKFLNKKYKLDRTENFDAILIELGVNSVIRAITKKLTTTVQLTKKDGGTYSLNSIILFVTTSQKFKLNEALDVTTADGRKVKNIFTVDGNILIEKQIGEKTLTIIREFFDDEMIATTEINGVSCKSWCKVVQ